MQGNIEFEAAREAAKALALELDREKYKGLAHISAFAEKCADGDGVLVCDDEPMTFSMGWQSDFAMSEKSPACGEKRGEVSCAFEDVCVSSKDHTVHDGTAAKLASDVCTGKVSAVKTAEEYISRAKKSEYGTFITVMKDKARERASAVDAAVRRGEKLPLAGVPLSIKDNICTAECLTSCASAALRDFVPSFDATVYERLIAAGCVPVGKVNMDEFAVGSDGSTSYFGICKNPLDLSRTPGGSSSGSAASVAAGEAVISIGSDTGGSARLPAIYCGLCALKPTYGAFSRYGLIGMAPSLEQICPIATCVDDLWLVFEAACGADGRDMTCASFGESTIRDERTVGVFISPDTPCDARDSVLHVAKFMSDAGYSVCEVELPCFDDILGIYYTLSSTEASSQLARYDGLRYGTRIGCDNNDAFENAKSCENNASDSADGTNTAESRKIGESTDDDVVRTRSLTFGAALRERLTEGAYVLNAKNGGIYITAARLREQIKREMTRLLSSVSVVITPATDRVATPVGESDFNADRYAVYANLTGQPALVLPCGRGENGLPLGVQLISRAGSDRDLLAIGRELERRTENEKL